ncbi:MAG: methionyl-tRNA formyltransferase [Verrucomicrobia bacterium]|jgi:methionyl-tRNA formyltransferase|nr:methionyl-tRNA formyltransferase [Verrucomicrobiota bacterium]
MRVVFMGSADIACPSLESLLSDPSVDVVGVVTQPDRPKGRQLKVSACAVRTHLEGSGIPVLTPQSINTEASLEALRALSPDLAVVMAYGQILKPTVLAVPRLGCINVHTSLLPLYRGAAPIQWAVANGDAETGVTIMHMDEGMDTGDIVLQRTIPIGPADTAGRVHDNLADAGAALLCEAVHAIQAGNAPRVCQDESRATYAPKLKKEDGRIDWTQSAEAIYNRVRGFNPWPCCTCAVPGARAHTLRVLTARLEDESGAPGEVLDVKGDGPLVACGTGALRLLEVQPQGKRVMQGCAYVCGRSLQRGEILG